MLATGKFKVELKPLESYAKAIDGVSIGRMSIDKTFFGDLSGESKGEMLSARSPLEGSAGYVAIEQVSGELNGKKGSFVLQHFGKMNSDGLHLILEVVADSASGELIGLEGKMNIDIEAGEHFYNFEYQLPD